MQSAERPDLTIAEAVVLGLILALFSALIDNTVAAVAFWLSAFSACRTASVIINGGAYAG